LLKNDSIVAPRTSAAFSQQQALSDCASALRIDPRNIPLLDNRGFAYLKLGRVSDAIDSFNAALKINSKFPTSLYGRGLAKMRNEDREGADIDMAEALSIKINVADDLARLGFKPD
jgi:tetratricopeptide (TPR) repeat protein